MLRLPAILLGASVALLGTTSAVPAQEGGEPVLARVLERRLDRLAADTGIRRLTSATTGLALLEAAPLAELGRLDDSTLVRYMDIFRRTLERADSATCASLWDPARGVTSAGFLGVAAQADSALAEEWTDVVEALVWAGLHGRTIGPRAPAVEVARAIARARAGLPPDDNRRLAQLAAASMLSASDRCFLARVAFRSYGLLPREHAGPILRTVLTP